MVLSYWGADKIYIDLGQNLENISVYFKIFMTEKQGEREKEEEKWKKYKFN